MKMIFYGGTIFTMGDHLYAQAGFIEDGRIRAVGKETGLRAFAPGAEL